MKLLSFIIFSLTVGCSKMATVPVSFSTTNDTSNLGAEPTKLELKHQEEGWIKVGMKVGDAKLDKLANGKSIEVAMAEVPKGEYTAVRASFSVQGKESTKGFNTGDRPSGNQGRDKVSYTVTTKTQFCAKGKKDNDLTVSIRQNKAESEPTIRVNQHPTCK